MFSVLSISPGCQPRQIGEEPVRVEAEALPAGVAEAYRKLTHSTQGLAERTEAAEALLRMQTYDAARALAASLNDEQDETTRRATLQAVAATEAQPPPGLWRPVLSLLYRSDERQAVDAAAALGRYEDLPLLKRLSTAAKDTTLPLRERQRAITALGRHRTQPVTQTLVDLTRLAEPAPVQEAAYEALAELSGIEVYDRDRRAWDEWWQSVKRLNAAQWQRHLLDNFVRRQAQDRATTDQLAEKLREAERALYLASSPEDQPRVMAYMLNSPLVSTRTLALDLAQTRLVASDQPFDESLKAALRDRLDDPSPQVRRAVAVLLRDLRDDAAADRVERKLTGDEEHVNAVLSAYLQMLALMPRKGAVDPAYEMLNEPALRADAAGTLAAIARAGQLAPKASTATARRLREILEQGERPSPELIALLGRVGNNDDWKQIRAWVSDRDPVIKQAAAIAWADSDRSLALLADRADDEVIQPIVINAAIQRGQDPQTLLSLANIRPTRLMTSWQNAIIAMSGRVPPRDVLAALKRIDDQATTPDTSLRERVLTAAIDRGPRDEPPSSDYMNLLLERAETRHAIKNPELAIADYDRLNKHRNVLDARTRERMDRGLIRAYLDANRIEDAIATASRFFADPDKPGSVIASTTDDPLMEEFIGAATREAKLGRTDRAQAILNQLRLLVGPNGLNGELAGRIRQIEETLSE